MRTCKDKYGAFASMICTKGESCDFYDEPEHCPDYREYRKSERMLAAYDSKQTKF